MVDPYVFSCMQCCRTFKRKIVLATGHIGIHAVHCHQGKRSNILDTTEVTSRSKTRNDAGGAGEKGIYFVMPCSQRSPVGTGR